MMRAILRAVPKGVLRTLMAHDVEGVIRDGHRPAGTANMPAT